MSIKFLIGQRVVICSAAIGYVIGPHVVTGEYINPVNGRCERVAPVMRPGHVWVYSLETGYASNYDEGNIQPLPGGQL